MGCCSKAALPSQTTPKAKVLHHLHSTAAPEAAQAEIVADIDRALDGCGDHDHMIAHARGPFEERDAASMELFKRSNAPAVIDGVTGGGEGAAALFGKGLTERINLSCLKGVFGTLMERENPVLTASKPYPNVILSP